MPCANCPDPSPRGATVYVVYSGGPERAHYAALAHVIPKRDERVILQYGWPTARPDGHLEYAGGQVPPVPEGYEATENPHVLKPVWASCAYRMLKAQMQLDTGLLAVDGACASPASGKHGRTLTLADCHTCPVRRAITDRAARAPSPPCPPGK
jgi:hypothetical protein